MRAIVTAAITALNVAAAPAAAETPNLSGAQTAVEASHPAAGVAPEKPDCPSIGG